MAMQPAQALLDGVADALAQTSRNVAQEIVLESTLHVSAVQAGQCMLSASQLSAPDVLSAADSQLPLDEQELLDALPKRLSEQLTLQEASGRKSLAACLATPSEPLEEEERQARAMERLSRATFERAR
jgi:hypothetical protein